MAVKVFPKSQGLRLIEYLLCSITSYFLLQAFIALEVARDLCGTLGETEVQGSQVSSLKAHSESSARFAFCYWSPVGMEALSARFPLHEMQQRQGNLLKLLFVQDTGVGDPD